MNFLNKNNNRIKLNKIVATVALPLIVTLTSANPTLAQKPNMGPKVSIQPGELLLPSRIGATKAYHMINGFQGESAARDLANKIFNYGNKIPQTINFSSNLDGSMLLHVSSVDPADYFQINTITGDFSFSKGFSSIIGDFDTPNLPGNKAAVQMAIKHLQALDLMPLHPEEMFIQHIGGLRAGKVNEDGSTGHYDKVVTVHFGRRLDGIDVSGPGSKIVVHLGSNGQLLGMHRRWIETESVDLNDNEFINQNQVFLNVANHLADEWDQAQKIESTTPEAGYYDDGNGNIEPAYFFVAKLTYDPQIHEFAKLDEYTNKYFGTVPALLNSFAEFRQLQPALEKPAKPDPNPQPEIADPFDDELK